MPLLPADEPLGAVRGYEVVEKLGARTHTRAREADYDRGAMPDEFTLTLRRPRGCPRWLWNLSSSDPIVHVGEHEHRPEWDSSQRLQIAPDGGLVRIEHVLNSARTSMAQKVEADVRPGDHLTYRASWWPRPLRRLTPT